MKVGILGGTFDPVHNGHLVIAGEVKGTFGLDRILFIPARQSPFKTDYAVTTAESRLEMLRLAVAGRPEYAVSTIEVERPGISYTVDTISELKKQYGEGNEWFFIMGWDSLERFDEWREPERIIELCFVVAVPRPDSVKPDLERLETKVPGIASRVIFTDSPLVDISSTDIRDMVSRGQSIDHLVPAAVAEYIQKHRLYIK
jgi:nicotinate-nucleotide adenylyltransferase